jgi:hypothetical protein
MHEKYRETLLSLSKAIEEIRGVFLNLNEKNNDIGLFPFEPIKDCYGLIKDLDPICGKQLTEEQRRKVRHQITALWKDVRKELLKRI